MIHLSASTGRASHYLHKLKDSAPNKKNMLVRAAWKPPKNIFNLVWGDATYPVCVRDHHVPKHKQCHIAKAVEANGITSEDVPVTDTKMSGGGLAALDARPKARAVARSSPPQPAASTRRWSQIVANTGGEDDDAEDEEDEQKSDIGDGDDDVAAIFAPSWVCQGNKQTRSRPEKSDFQERLDAMMGNLDEQKQQHEREIQQQNEAHDEKAMLSDATSTRAWIRYPTSLIKSMQADIANNQKIALQRMHDFEKKSFAL